jgi:hypothetical protein
MGKRLNRQVRHRRGAASVSVVRQGRVLPRDNPSKLMTWSTIRAKPTQVGFVGVAPPFQGEGDRICVYTVALGRGLFPLLLREKGLGDEGR